MQVTPIIIIYFVIKSKGVIRVVPMFSNINISLFYISIASGELVLELIKL